MGQGLQVAVGTQDSTVRHCLRIQKCRQEGVVPGRLNTIPLFLVIEDEHE